MPYIKQSARELMDAGKLLPAGAGTLNYAITKTIDRYLVTNGVTYSNLNEVIGVLECVKFELYRRVAGPLEDRKRDENGEVYTCVDP